MDDITASLILIDNKGYYVENQSALKEDHITVDWDQATFYVGKIAISEGVKRVRHFFGDLPILETKYLKAIASDDEFTLTKSDSDE